MSLKFQALKPLHMLSSPSGTQSSLSPSPLLSRGNPCLSLPSLLCHRPNTQLWVTELTEYHGFLKYGHQYLIILRTLAGTCHGASSNDVSCHWTVFLLWCTCQKDRVQEPCQSCSSPHPKHLKQCLCCGLNLKHIP